MKIALISIPMPTFNNRGAASALPYHLIKGAGKDARFEVWTYNSNHIPPSDVAETERALGVKIHILRRQVVDLRRGDSPFCRFLPRCAGCSYHARLRVVVLSPLAWQGLRHGVFASGIALRLGFLAVSRHGARHAPQPCHVPFRGPTRHRVFQGDMPRGQRRVPAASFIRPSRQDH